MPQWVIGLVSGTSADGVDVASAGFELHGEVLHLIPGGYFEVPYPEPLRARLLDPSRCNAADLCELDAEIGQCFAAAAERGMDLAGPAELVSALGQTAHHWVENGRVRGTLQLGQPAWIAERTGLAVVSDLRARDVAAGGQGAPLAGLLDALWLDERTAALNLGGIANISVPGRAPLAYDTGPGNALLDVAASLTGRGAQDTDGELAARGSVRTDLLEALLADPHYRREPPKSTGKEHFNAEHLRRHLAAVPPVADADLLATLTELTATTAAAECRAHGVRRVVASGGGVNNPSLLAALRRRLGEVELLVSDELGLPAGGKEAYLAALLGFLAAHGLPGNLPATTGAAGPRVLGSFTPGEGPLRLPPPAATGPSRLQVVPHDREGTCAPSTSW